MKRVKGMTLLEIVISLAIFALLSTVILQVISTTNNIMKATNYLTERLYMERSHANTNEAAGLDDEDIALNKSPNALSVVYGDQTVVPTVPVKQMTTKTDVDSMYSSDLYNNTTHYRFLSFNKVEDSDDERNYGLFFLDLPESEIDTIHELTLKSDTETLSYKKSDLEKSELPDQLLYKNGMYTIFFELAPGEYQVDLEMKWDGNGNGRYNEVKDATGKDVPEPGDRIYTMTFTFKAYDAADDGDFYEAGESTAYVWRGAQEYVDAGEERLEELIDHFKPKTTTPETDEEEVA